MAGSFDPDELEFLAEDITVTIIPTVQYPVFYMLTGDIGPMEPSIPVDVPLWLAVHMRKRKQCRLVVPAWLSAEALTEQKEKEDKTGVFEPVPSPHYIEIAQIVLENFADDIADCGIIRRLIKDVLDLRLAKLRTSVDSFIKKGNTAGKMQHITQLELCSLRNLLTCGVDQMDMLKRAGLPSADQGSLAGASNFSLLDSTSSD